MLSLTNLDDVTRLLMRSEVASDIAAGGLYESPRLSDRGKVDYPSLLLDATTGGTDGSFADELNALGRLKDTETATRYGKTFLKKVPVTAAEPRPLPKGNSIASTPAGSAFAQWLKE